MQSVLTVVVIRPSPESVHTNLPNGAVVVRVLVAVVVRVKVGDDVPVDERVVVPDDVELDVTVVVDDDVTVVVEVLVSEVVGDVVHDVV